MYNTLKTPSKVLVILSVYNGKKSLNQENVKIYVSGIPFEQRTIFNYNHIFQLFIPHGNTFIGHSS